MSDRDAFRAEQQERRPVGKAKLRPLLRELWTYTHFLLGLILVTGDDGQSDWQILWWLMGAWWIQNGVRRVIREAADGE
jgi:hypothetical protein